MNCSNYSQFQQQNPHNLPNNHNLNAIVYILARWIQWKNIVNLTMFNWGLWWRKELLFRGYLIYRLYPMFRLSSCLGIGPPSSWRLKRSCSCNRRRTVIKREIWRQILSFLSQLRIITMFKLIANFQIVSNNGIVLTHLKMLSNAELWILYLILKVPEHHWNRWWNHVLAKKLKRYLCSNQNSDKFILYFFQDHLYNIIELFMYMRILITNFYICYCNFCSKKII